MSPPETIKFEPSRLTLPDGASIAYHAMRGKSPGVLFLSGFKSDMTGTKASALAAWCAVQGRAFLRFDYLGHGRSSGIFTDGTIGTWRDNALAVLDRLTEGPQVLVGSSLGGWLMTLVALARPDRVAGLVGIAAAPDFTEDLMWAAFDEKTRAQLVQTGRIDLASDYEPESYPITLRLIEEARRHLLLRGPIELRRPVRLLHGMADKEVPWQTSIKLACQIDGGDVVVLLIMDGEHRLSRPSELERLCAVIAELAR